jgi:hypothetical protein
VGRSSGSTSINILLSMVILFEDKMARRTPGNTAKPPAERQQGAAYFYAAEVVGILGLEGIDYAQLRRLLRLVRPPDAQPSRSWARFSFEDLAGIRVALRLAGGTEALADGKRLQIAELERTCSRLRQLGIARPLLDVPLRREGRAIVAEVDGVTFRPVTGQLALTDISNRVGAFLGEIVYVDRPGLARLRSAIAQDHARLSNESRSQWVVEPRRGRLAP